VERRLRAVTPFIFPVRFFPAPPLQVQTAALRLMDDSFSTTRLRIVPDDEVTSGVTLEDAFARYASYVGSIGLRLLGRSDEVDDLIQDVFLEAHRRFDTLHSPAAIKHWLTTVTVRTARRRLRRRALRRVIGLESSEAQLPVEIPAQQLSPEGRVALQRALGLLERLPANERLAWTLRHVEGYQVKEIAAHMDCTTRSVRRYITKADARLERWLAE